MQQRYHQPGNALDQKLGGNADVLFQPVNGVAGQKTVTAVPAGPQHVAEELFAKEILSLDVVVTVPPVSKDDGEKLQDQDPYKKTYAP